LKTVIVIFFQRSYFVVAPLTPGDFHIKYIVNKGNAQSLNKSKELAILFGMPPPPPESLLNTFYSECFEKSNILERKS